MCIQTFKYCVGKLFAAVVVHLWGAFGKQMATVWNCLLWSFANKIVQLSRSFSIFILSWLTILQRLTSGILLSRDKEYIVLYRGKDFLPSAVSSAIEERRRNRMDGDKLVADGSSGKTTDKILQGTEGHPAAFVSEKNKGQILRNVSQEQKMRSVQTNITKTSRKLSMVSIQKDGVSTKGFSF